MMEKEFGPQPLDTIIDECGLTNKDLVSASTEQLTHKMVKKGRDGRKLTMRVKLKIQRALAKAAGREFTVSDLFNYK